MTRCPTDGYALINGACPICDGRMVADRLPMPVPIAAYTGRPNRCIDCRTRKRYRDKEFCWQCFKRRIDTSEQWRNANGNRRGNGLRGEAKVVCRGPDNSQDGRLDRLKAFPRPPKIGDRPCANCNGPTPVLNRGRCGRCAAYFWRFKKERPSHLFALQGLI
jgi:hypothetical protein